MGKTGTKLLVICGVTAIGKTQLALRLALEFDGVLISADSRQVYKYMDIGTGKEKDKYGEILGYDLVNPDEEFSVSQYSRFASQKIREIQKQKKLPILVGGTGFYIKAVVDGIETMNVQPDSNLRLKFKDKTPQELFEILKKLDAEKAKSMNNSDKNNTRRLVRAIEISNFQILTPNQFSGSNLSKYDTLFVGLTASLPVLKKRIEERVDERIKSGFQGEVNFLKENGYWSGAPSMTLGYKDWPDIEKWKREEFKYAKRQMTWFKKDLRINWFDISKPNFYDDVEKLTKKWYSQKDYAKEN